jgi:hypothetical protein
MVDVDVQFRKCARSLRSRFVTTYTVFRLSVVYSLSWTDGKVTIQQAIQSEQADVVLQLAEEHRKAAKVTAKHAIGGSKAACDCISKSSCKPGYAKVMFS